MIDKANKMLTLLTQIDLDKIYLIDERNAQNHYSLSIPYYKKESTTKAQ